MLQDKIMLKLPFVVFTTRIRFLRWDSRDLSGGLLGDRWFCGADQSTNGPMSDIYAVIIHTAYCHAQVQPTSTMNQSFEDQLAYIGIFHNSCHSLNVTGNKDRMLVAINACQGYGKAIRWLKKACVNEK